MRPYLFAPLLALGLASAAPAAQTVLLFRHAEKPAAGLGQLSCQGLNRALALPAVLERASGRPDALYAPNPGMRKEDQGISYNYIRPLATIEPAAIRLGLPVNTDYGLDQIGELADSIASPQRAQSVVWVAWEHARIGNIVTALAGRYKAAAPDMPKWKGSDFDSLWRLRLSPGKAELEILHQGLDNQPERCPG